MYKPQNTVLSTNSYNILNAIRNDIGGEFRQMTPLVKSSDDAKVYGLYVTGSGDARNAFMTGLINRIADQWCKIRSYENSLKKFKKGMLGPGEMIENIWIGLTMPEGYSPSPTNPGDVYKTNNPENIVTFHPVNSKLVYETTTNDSELSMAFVSEGAMYDLVARIVGRLTDSAEWDEYIMTKYVLARAILANPSAIKYVPELKKANSDDIVTVMKEVSNDMRFMNTTYNVAEVATTTPVESQVFFMTAKSSAVIDTNSLAMAYNLRYRDFLAQREMLNRFDFTDAELKRLDVIMSETVKAGLVPNYTPLTDEEKTTLSHIIAATVDEDFFMIFDKLYQTTSCFNQKYLYTNVYLHTWKVYSYNPFANSVFFSDKVQAAG